MAYSKNEIKKLFDNKNITFKGQSDLMRLNARKSNSKLRPDGYIYILKLKGFDAYKIGVSSNPKRRLSDIDSVMPFDTEILCLEWFKNVYNMEECIHDSFSSNLMRREWFKIHPEDINTLKNELKKMSKDRVFLTKR